MSFLNKSFAIKDLSYKEKQRIEKVKAEKKIKKKNNS